MNKQANARAMLSAKYIWVYGAGIVGTRAAHDISQMPWVTRVQGVVVTHKSEETTIEGYSVYSIDEIDTPNEDTFFILAVSEKYREELSSILQTKGYDHYGMWMPQLRWYLTDFIFIDRKKDLAKVCYVLSGYKEFLWDVVFERLKKYIPADVEICILSSGVHSERLEKMAEDNDWSYLYTKLNDLTLAQNILLRLFEKAEWIYKMDEDIFLTEGCFDKLFHTFRKVEDEEPYCVGFTAPLLPLNGYSYIHILEHYGKLSEYETKFGRATFGGYYTKPIECEPKVAEYMWGDSGGLPHLDDMNKDFQNEWKYSVCGLRFSIGFILFRRSYWDEINGFGMTGGTDLGKDEIELCSWSGIVSRAMIVSHDTVVGHFSFGPQTDEMKKYYKDHQERFAIRER